MAFQAREALTRAGTLLNDASSVRWPLLELLGWLNDAVREIALHKPSATAATITMELAAGTKQSVPDGYHAILKVVRNVASGEVITPIDVAIMNRLIPNWHSAAALPFSVDVTHVIDDETDPAAFYVLPGNTGAGEIEVVASALPAPIAAPANPLSIASYTTTIPLPDIYLNAVVDYILYRAFSKDVNLATAGARAQAHWAQFANAIGLKAAAEAANNINVNAQTRNSPQ